MRQALFYISFFLSSVLCAQQSKPVASTEYFYMYGGKSFDEARSVKELPGKQYILAGTSSSFGQGNTSAYLIRTDSTGKHLWSYPYGGNQNDWAYSVEVTQDSGYFVAGYSNSFNPPNGYDAWYFKTDKNGNLLWQKTVSGDDWDFIYGSAPMPDGGFVLCGETYTHSNGNADGYLIRVDKNGDTLWNKHYGGALNEKFNSVCLMGNNLYAVGSNYTFRTDSAADGWMVKLDTNGNVLGTGYIIDLYHMSTELKGILAYDDTSLIVCGKLDLIDSGSTQSIIGRVDTSLVFTYGPYKGGNTAGGNYNDFNRVFKISYGRVCAVGTATGGWGGLNLFTVSYYPYIGWVPGSAHDCGKVDDEYGYDGIYTSSGRVIFVGSAAYLCTANPNMGLQDAYLVRFESDSINNSAITSTVMNCFADTLFYWAVSQHVYSIDTHVGLYPNPAHEHMQLEVTTSDAREHTARIFSMLGVEIIHLKVSANTPSRLDVSSLPAGTYFLKIENSDHSNISTVKFVKE